MRKGDISNELPKRILINSDVFTETEVTVKKRFKIIPSPKVNKKVRRDILSYLYLYTTNRGVTLELVSYDMDDEKLGVFIEDLDRLGANPFRYWTSYASVNHLVKELPFRPEVVGVVDIQSRLLRYGSRGMDVSDL